jgi:hypothetical protein
VSRENGEEKKEKRKLRLWGNNLSDSSLETDNPKTDRRKPFPRNRNENEMNRLNIGTQKGF